MISRRTARAIRRRARLVFPAVFLTLVTLSCDGTEPRRATALAIVAQPPTTAQSGVTLGQAVTVEVRDQKGSAFAQSGVPIVASIADGGGSLSGTTTQLTNAEGRAIFSDLVISGTVGTKALRFSAAALTDATSSSITLTPGPAAALEAQSAAAVQATVGTAVGTLPAVVVKDASGNGVSGVAVTFAVASGGGQITGPAQTTNASGVATLGGWTLPTVAGQYTVTATAASIAGPAVTFTATATPDVPSVMQPSGGGQSGLYGSRLATPLQVRVVDKYGNPVRDVVVTWGLFSGVGTVEPIDVSTNADGIVRSNYRLGNVPGEYVVRASINPLSLHVDFPAMARGLTNEIDVGPVHTCAIDDIGVAYCWGKNDFGQIGDGTNTNRERPVAVGGSLRFRRIKVGGSTTCGLTTDNVAYCWGWNAEGSLGDGTTVDRLVPTPVSGNLRFSEITTSGLVSCGITASATYCWGLNEGGQLGTGDIEVDACTSRTGNGFRCSRTPLEVGGGHTFATVSAAPFHVCGLTSTQELYCWGTALNWGGPSGSVESLPKRVDAGLTFAQITVADGYTCGIVAPSAPYCWGLARFGELGIGVTEGQVNTPTRLPSHIEVLRIEAGDWGACALATDGRGFCWGYNVDGAVGDGTTGTPRNTPSTVATGESFTAIGRSSGHGCGRTDKGQVICWGNNGVGQLGNGGGGNSSTPVLARP